MTQPAASPASSGPSGGNAPAARGAPTAPTAPRTQGGSPAAEGGDFDYRSELERTRRDLDGERGARSKLEERTNRQDQTLERLRQAFDPEASGPEPGSVEALEATMDEVINAAYAADKAGKPIPLTTRAYLQALQTAIDQKKFQQEFRDELKKIGGQAAAANDPQMQVNRTAYASIDTAVQRGLDSLYGMDESANPTKSHLFDAVGRQIADYVKRLQKEKPQAWERIRRDPAQLNAMALHYLKQTLPPKAVAILEQQNLQDTPMSEGELMRAFQEAEEIKDPVQRRKIREKIRGEILEARYGSKSKRSG